jgi:hypothetical protein
MSHAHNVAAKLTVAMIKSVEGLEKRMPAYVKLTDPTTLPQAWGCSHSCNWVKLFGCSFIVDFAAGIILDDPDSRPCERAPGAGQGATSTTETMAKKHIRHARVDVGQHLDKFKREALQRPPQISIYDEALMAAVGPDKALQLQFPEKVPPSSFLVTMRMLAIQIAELIAANAAFIAATMIQNAAKNVKQATGPRNAITTGAPATQMTLDIPNKNNITFACLLRGLLEFADHSALTHRSLYSSTTCGYHDFMAALHDNMRPDIAEITKTIQDPEEITKDVAAALDGNVFFAAGAHAMLGAKPAMEEFFRKEAGRFLTVAKNAGWKPKPKPTPSTPTPTKPSPDRATDPSAGTKRKPDTDLKHDTDGDDTSGDSKHKSRFQAKKGGGKRRRKGGDGGKKQG